MPPLKVLYACPASTSGVLNSDTDGEVTCLNLCLSWIFAGAQSIERHSIERDLKSKHTLDKLPCRLTLIILSSTEPIVTLLQSFHSGKECASDVDRTTGETGEADPVHNR